ncbi:MAG: general stress protein [Anaerolineales bacterium]
MSTDRSNAVVRDYTGRTVVAAVFTDRSQAERAIDALRAAGFTGKQVGVAMRDRSEAGELMKDTGTSAVEGAVSGAVGGGLLGGVAGFLVGLVSALIIPGVGPIVAAGALASALGAAGGTAVAGAGIGAAAGGLVGALTGLGFPEDEAKYFETGFRSGGVLVTVHAEGRSTEAVAILQRYGGDVGAGSMAR